MFNALITRTCRRPAILLAVLLGTLTATTSSASAALLMYEGFNYTAGQNLSNQTHTASGNQWLRPTTPAGAVQVIAAGDVDYPGLKKTAPSNSVAVPRPSLANQSENRIDIPGRPYTRDSGASLFFSFTVEMTSFTTFGPGAGADTKNDAAAKNITHRKGGFLAGFHGGPASTSTAMSASNGFAAPIYVRREIDFTQTGTDGTPGTQTGKYEFGITKQAFPASPTIAETNLSFDQSQSFGVGDKVLIVGQYDFVDLTTNTFGDVAKLWINPVPGNLVTELTPSWVASPTSQNLGGSLSLESFHIRADTNSPGAYRLDNVRIGTSFADVTPPVPEPSTLVLLALGTLCCVQRRRGRC